MGSELLNIIRGLSELKNTDFSESGVQIPVCTIGFFDGVHRGHASLVKDLSRWAQQLGGTPMVITFANHPKEITLGHAPAMLTPVSTRLQQLEELGIEWVILLEFDEDLASWSAERFVDEVIQECVQCRHLLMGFDSAFGQGARGTFDYLQQLNLADLELRSSPPLLVEGEAVSSSAVRACLQEGDLRRVTLMLDRPYSLSGPVITGDQRGRTIGFPTANLDPGKVLVPPVGVYVGRAILLEEGGSPGEIWPTAINIGRRPTFGTPEAPEGTPFDPALDRLEAHLDGFSGDLYGRTIAIEFHRRLRGERKFSSLDSLKQQIVRDVESLRDWWRGFDGGTAAI